MQILKDGMREMSLEKNIRNFCIIAHIDHGKSTLADRFLEITGAVNNRKMRAQYLDRMDLERERGITIKMAPVRMVYHSDRNASTEARKDAEGKVQYILNLIDTPGHSDFRYEVSRALAAVEGAILLVDASQGIQAQTLANFRAAEKAGLKILGAVNKIDLFEPEKRETEFLSVVKDLADLIGCDSAEICRVSGRTGEGVLELLQAVIKKFPSPEIKTGLSQSEFSRALVFDSFYDNHKGIIAEVRVFDGSFINGAAATAAAGEFPFKVKEVGHFTPELKSETVLRAGEIGYIATGIKDPAKIKIGDTIVAGVAGEENKLNSENLKKGILPGYEEPQPVVFVSFYPEDANHYEALKNGLDKLKLNDAAIAISPEQNKVMGRGFKAGFLGRLHFEITAERLKREFKTDFISTFPSVVYCADTAKGKEMILNPDDLPTNRSKIYEPMVKAEIIMPEKFLNNFFAFQARFRMKNLMVESGSVGGKVIVKAVMPLRELMEDFDDVLKSATEGYGSLSYVLGDYEPADVLRVRFLAAGEPLPGLSRFFHRDVFLSESRKMVRRLKEILPPAQFKQAVQAEADGRIIAREDIPALRKDVTGYLYGGDRTRKMKLWQKQKKGKEKLKTRSSVKIKPEVFRELLRN